METEDMRGGEKGGGRAAGQRDEIGNGFAQCSDHPLMVNHGGVCAFCLQEKLCKLVSSPFSLSLSYSTSSSSSSPSFRSNYAGAAPSASSLSLSIRATASKSVHGGGPGGSVHRRDEHNYSGRAWIPFLTAKKKKKNGADGVFMRSKSTTTYTMTPRRNRCSDSINGGGGLNGRNRGGFWSFLNLASSTRQSWEKTEKSFRENSKILSMAEPTLKVYSMGKNGTIVEEEDGALDSSIDRKVSRSRSVGCGSRNFSGDMCERISAGFGDCTLRGVDSREIKPKASPDRVKCGGLFGGFMATSSSSSSSSDQSNSSKPPFDSIPPPHRRSKSWNWAFSSPAFYNAPSSKDLENDTVREHSDKNTSSNWSGIPPLMAARS